MRLAFILLFFATAAHGQFIINPYWFAQVGAFFTNNEIIELDGVDQYVVVDDADNLTQTDNSITISAYVWTWDRTKSTILHKSGEYALFWSNQNYLCAEFYDTEGDKKGGEYRVATGEKAWLHIAVTFNGSTVKFYVNGQNKTPVYNRSSGVFDGMINTAGDLKIGAKGTESDGGYWDGVLDQVAIWDVVLTQQEIREAMTIQEYNRHSRAANLISWWEFDDDDETTSNGIIDKIGGNNGTGQNMDDGEIQVGVNYPNHHQLVNNAVYDSISPYQYGFTDSIHGGWSWDFDGISDYLLIPDNDALSFTNDTVGIGAWVQMDNVTNFVIAEKEGEYLFWVNASNKLEARFIDAEGDYIGRTYDTDLNTEFQYQWMYAVATFDGTNVNLYINSNEVDDTDANSGTYGGMTNTANDLTIAYDGANYANGEIADIALFDKVLSAAEIDTLFNRREPRNETFYNYYNNIVGYWRPWNSWTGSGAVLDQSTNSNDGTLQSFTLDYIKLGYPRRIIDSVGSFAFDNTGTEYIDVPDDPSISFGDAVTTQDFTVSFWMKVDSLADNRTFVKKSGTNLEWMFRTTQNTGQRMYFYLYDEYSSQFAYQRGITPPLNSWHHVVGVFRKESQGIIPPALYQNGTQQNTQGTSSGFTAIHDTSEPIRIAGSFPKNGQIAHVVVIGAALTPYQVRELYNNGVPIDINRTTFADDVISYWLMDETDDPTGTVTDIIGTNDGTPYNMEAGDLILNDYPRN